MPDNWYYRTGKKQHGPVSWLRLTKMAGNGALVPEDLVRQGEVEEWKPAGECAGLFGDTATQDSAAGAGQAIGKSGKEVSATEQPPQVDAESSGVELAVPSELPELTELPEIAELPELTDLDEIQLCEANDAPAQPAVDSGNQAAAVDAGAMGGSSPQSDQNDGEADSSDETAGWYCQVFGYLMGPMRFADLQLLANNGEIGPDDRVREGRNEQWRQAGSVPDLVFETETQDTRVEQEPLNGHSDAAWPASQPHSSVANPPPVPSGDGGTGFPISQGDPSLPLGGHGLTAGALSAAVADATSGTHAGGITPTAGTTVIQVNIPLPGGGVQTIDVPIQLEAALQSGSSPSISIPTQPPAVATVPVAPVPAQPSHPAPGAPVPSPADEPSRPAVRKSKKKRKKKSDEDDDGDDRWYCRLNDTVHGPVTAEQLNRLALAGRLKAEDEVRLGKDGAWAPAGLFPELFERDEDHLVGIDLEQLMANRSEIVQETGSTGSNEHSANLAGMMRNSQAEMIRDPEKFRRVEEVEEELTTADRLRKNAGYIVAIVVGLGIVLSRLFPSSNADFETFLLYQSVYDRFVEIRENGADTSKYNALKEEAVPKIKPIVEELEKTASAAEPVKQHLLWAGKDHLIPMLDDARSEPSENEQFFVDHMENARKILEAENGGALPSGDSSADGDAEEGEG